MVILACLPGAGVAASCLAPPRPFVPSDSEAARDYADLIRGDFETYIQDIQSYFRCLDGERARRPSDVGGPRGVEHGAGPPSRAVE